MKRLAAVVVLVLLCGCTAIMQGLGIDLERVAEGLRVQLCSLPSPGPEAGEVTLVCVAANLVCEDVEEKPVFVVPADFAEALEISGSLSKGEDFLVRGLPTDQPEEGAGPAFRVTAIAPVDRPRMLNKMRPPRSVKNDLEAAKAEADASAPKKSGRWPWRWFRR